MKILIAADMEGITGVTNWDQVNPDHAEYPRFRKLMTNDVNAAICGAIAGGATSVLVKDGHHNDTNILIEDLDPRAILFAGSPSPMSMVEGVDQNVDGVIFIGYHARMGTPNAILEHTWSDEIVSGVWLNDRAIGEAGLNGAVCGHFNVPVIMASGDQALCAEVKELFGNVIETAQVKKALSRMSAECLPPSETSKLIEGVSQLAVKNLREGKAPKPFSPTKPIKLEIEFIQSSMADNAQKMPGAIRGKDRHVSFSADDMLTIYRAFQSLVALAG